jgi:hypothetical protein
MSDNPMVSLNRAVAAMVHGPRTGLDMLKELDADGRLAGHHRLYATRAHLLEMRRPPCGRRRLPGGGEPGDRARLPHHLRRPSRRR